MVIGQEISSNFALKSKKAKVGNSESEAIGKTYFSQKLKLLFSSVSVYQTVIPISGFSMYLSSTNCYHLYKHKEIKRLSHKCHGALLKKKMKKASLSQSCYSVKMHIVGMKSQSLNLSASIILVGVTVLDCNSKLKSGHGPVSRRGCQRPFIFTAMNYLSDSGKLSYNCADLCRQEENTLFVLTGCSFLDPSL